jgi:hypothetical protein
MIAVLPAAGLASGPGPQPAPTTTQTSAPSPDPAPQATTPTHTPTHTSVAPTQTHSSTPAPTHVAPATSVTRPRVVDVAPARVVTHAVSKKPHRPRPQSHPRHRSAPTRHVTHHAQPAPAPVVKVAAVHRAPAARHDGLMLAVGAVVLLVLVATSLALLRRVTRLHREVTTA